MSRPVDPELRLRLLEAATEVFSERGFGGATMALIGRRAGVTKGGVYFHFRGKEELFFAVFDARREALSALLAPRARQGMPGSRGSAAAALRRFLADYLEFHFHDPHAARLVHVLVSELRDSFTTTLREDAAREHRMLRARIRDLLARGNQDASLFVPDPAFAAFVVASALRGVLDQWLTAPGDAEPFCRADSLAEELVLRYATGTIPTAAREPTVDEANADFRPY